MPSVCAGWMGAVVFLSLDNACCVSPVMAWLGVPSVKWGPQAGPAASADSIGDVFNKWFMTCQGFQWACQNAMWLYGSDSMGLVLTCEWGHLCSGVCTYECVQI